MHAVPLSSGSRPVEGAAEQLLHTEGNVYASWEELAEELADDCVEYAQGLERQLRGSSALDGDEEPQWRTVVLSCCLAMHVVAEVATKHLGGGSKYASTLADPLLHACMTALGKAENEFPGKFARLSLASACANFTHYSRNMPLTPMTPGEHCALRNWAKLVGAPDGGGVERRKVEQIIAVAEPSLRQWMRGVRSKFYAAPKA